MKNEPFNYRDDTLMEAVRNFLEGNTKSQRGDSGKVYPETETIALDHIDLTDPENPRVVFRGAGSMPYNMRGKDIAMRLKELAADISSGILTMQKLHDAVMNEKHSSGNLTFFYLAGYAEAEKLMESQKIKSKLTNLKKVKGK